MVVPSFATSHEKYYYKIGLHWHQAMHGYSDTFNVHLKRLYNDFKYTRHNIIVSAKLRFKCAVGMWEYELVEID